MIERSQRDIRDTGLDIAQIGTEVRMQLAQLTGHTEEESKNLREWLRALETDPSSIKNDYRKMFVLLRERFANDEVWIGRLDAWEERLSEVNS